MDSIILILSTALLLYAGYSDIRSRRVSNTVWLVMAGMAVILAGYRTVSEGMAFIIPLFVSFAVTGIIAYVFYSLGFFGAADAKAVICIALLFPVQPEFGMFGHVFPLVAPPASVAVPPALLVLLNSAVLALAVPFWLLGRNLLSSGMEGIADGAALVFVAYRTSIERLYGRRFVRLAHVYEESGGQVSRRYMPGGSRINGRTLRQLAAYQRKGKVDAAIWVTPEVPFVLFITLGFITYCLFGI